MDDDCIYCHGDGMDPDNDYLLPCPYCDGTGEMICSEGLEEEE